MVFYPNPNSGARGRAGQICTRLYAALLASLVFLGTACSTAPRGASQRGGDIVRLNIMTMPVGLNFDQRPGIDGFSAKVYANNASNPKTVPLSGGRLEILMWDGSLFGSTNIPPALHIWRYTADELNTFRFQSGIGTGYEFTLIWGNKKPTQQLITVAARYTSPAGEIVTSRPSSVTVIDK